MNKISIFITALAALTVLSGCVSARKQQNPQPKLELICEDWDQNIPAETLNKSMTVQQAAEKFIQACTVGDYQHMFGTAGRYPELCNKLASATISNIRESVRVKNSWDVTVKCPSDSVQRTFSLDKVLFKNKGKTEFSWNVTFKFR